jgi:hypothetical protein
MQSDNPNLDLHIARKAIREKLATIAGSATAAQLKELFNLLVADMALDDPTITVDAATLPADVKKPYEKAQKRRAQRTEASDR